LTKQCNVSCFMLRYDYSRVPRARAHAIKNKASYCLLTSWGSTTTAARSPTATTYTTDKYPSQIQFNSQQFVTFGMVEVQYFYLFSQISFLKGKCETRTSNLSSLKNLRIECKLYLAPKSSWQKWFRNHFYENYGNCWEMTGK
jgi:hypothetical protein